MFNREKVITALNGVVGWAQPLDPASPVLNASNLASSSGYRFDENALVKIQSLKDCQDYPAISDTEFNTYLKELQDTSIANVLNSVFNESDYIDRQVLYQYPNNKINVESLPDGFVGYEIDITTDKNFAFEISRILLEFQGTGDIELLLFNSSKSTPIESKVVTIANSLQEETLNWRVDNTDTFYKGKFYLGYLTSGLEVTPYERDYENANVRSKITGVNLNPISVSGHSTKTLFDLNDIDSNSECWGLNPDITVFDDFTDLIKQNLSLFAKAIQTQGQIECISIYLAASRSNRNERFTESQVNKMVVELEGLDSDVKITGLRHKLFGELSRIRKEIKRLQLGYFPNGFISNTRE